MQITEIKVIPVREEKLKAYVTIVLDASFVVRDLKIIQGTNGLFISMPNKRLKDGSFRDIVHPANHETRTFLEEQVLRAYLEEVRIAAGVRPVA